MYFSRISFASSADRDVVSLARQVCADAYREHQSLWRLFEKDPDAERDFLFRREQVGRWPRYFMVSDREPAYIDGLWRIESKPYAPGIASGQVLAFSLRVNPVVTRTNEAGRKQRHDVVMDRKKQIDYSSMTASERPPMANLIDEAGIHWLERRAEKHGFSFDPDGVRVDGYLRHRVSKKGGKTICFSTLDYTGLLAVDDTALFKTALFQGIGPAKAFGCGLLLVRRTS